MPLALNERGLLAGLFTDIWINSQTPAFRLLSCLISGLAGRNADISRSKIHSFNTSAFRFEFLETATRHKGWQRMYNRNRWFQERVIQSRGFADLFRKRNISPIVYCYSYAALNIFKRAKDHGCFTVLGQIDGGLEEENIVANAVTRHLDLVPQFERAPDAYWEDWQEECRIADRIVVNSEWSRQLLNKAGVVDNKIKLVPLIFNTSDSVVPWKNYPDAFTNDRPLKVLFLGNLIIRKGIGEMLKALKMLEDQPIEFWFIGQEGVSAPAKLLQSKRVHWAGPVPRLETAQYYRMCDVFILPTLSDGFGLTQLEAMNHGLPVVASTRCGAVVEHNVNGLLLPEVTSENIVDALKYCLNNPKKLGVWSGNALQRVRDFSSQYIFPQLVNSINP